jgi:phage terminase large subunit
MRILVSDHFFTLLGVEDRYLVLGGGKGSGKSEFAARKIFVRCQREGGHRVNILRKVSRTNRDSTLEVILRLLDEQEIEYLYDRTHLEIRFTAPNGQQNVLMFRGLDDRQKIKSIKGVTMVWLEEATEFTEADFLEIDLAFREPCPYYKQIILTFNPVESLAPWLKRRFFPDDPKDRDPRAYTDISTIEDNPSAAIREQYMIALDAIKDPVLKQIYRFGIWARPTGVIYNWPIVSAPPENPDEIFYGLDFGYSINPTALIRIYRKGNKFYLEQLIYEAHLVNQQIITRMRTFGIPRLAPIYADSAEPKSIQEISLGGFNVKPADKGPDSVLYGIQYCQEQDISVIAGSSELIKEAATYKWAENKDGDPIAEPVKYNDHGMDGVRYGIVTHMRKSPVVFGMINVDIMPK